MKRLLAWLGRRWLLVAATIAFLVLVILQLGNLELLGATLIRGIWQWLLVAALLQVAYYLFYAYQYELGFAAVEVASRWVELVPVMFASIFLTTIVPSGGVSSLAVFVDDAARRGQSSARAAEGALLVLIADLVTIAPFVAYGLAYLSLRGVLQVYQVIGVIALLVFTLGLAAAILLGRWFPEQLRSFFEWLETTANWLARLVRHPPLVPPDWSERQARDYVGAARHIGDHPRELTCTLLLALGLKVVNLASLFAVALAYHELVSVGAATAAFVMDYVFSIVVVIPQGLGVAEGILALVFTDLGVPPANALAISIVYRGLNVWVPLFIGFLFLRYVRSFGR